MIMVRVGSLSRRLFVLVCCVGAARGVCGRSGGRLCLLVVCRVGVGVGDCGGLGIWLV